MSDPITVTTPPAKEAPNSTEELAPLSAIDATGNGSGNGNGSSTLAAGRV